MDFLNTKFYDDASKNYSRNRYSLVSVSYINFFFKKRLKIVVNQISNIISNNYHNQDNLTLLESGCADGVVINKIIKEFPNRFSVYVGTDISQGMIDEAIKQNKFENVRYYLKGKEDGDLKYDIVLAIGYLSPGIFDQEFGYLLSNLKKDGFLIISLASRNSIYTKLKLNNKEYIRDYWSHNEYYKYLSKRFDIVSISTCGLFIPKLWKFPYIARIFQPVIEDILDIFIPNLYHEKIFVLKIRN